MHFHANTSKSEYLESECVTWFKAQFKKHFSYIMGGQLDQNGTLRHKTNLDITTWVLTIILT